MLTALVIGLVLVADAPPVDAVMIAPREFLPALAPLIQHREQQGHRIAVLPNVGTPEQIRVAIRNVAAGGKLKYLVLVGDAEPVQALPVTRGTLTPALSQREWEERLSRSVPTHLQPATVNVRFGSEPQIASDNWYADLDDDQLPDLAVGRIPADSAAELARIVAKILAYERNADFGPWRQRVNFVAGVGGFSPILDTVIESATSKLLTGGIPAAYETRMTFGSWRSPYCPDPRLFHAMTVERHNEGCLFWVYIGHGQATELDRVSIPGERFHILNCDDCRELKARGGAPIAIMLACYTAAFDQAQDCLAEQLLKAEGGPVAVYGGSRVTMPYAMGVMGTALMDEYFQKRPTTLGDAILAAKRRTMTPIDDTENPVGTSRMLLDGVAAMMSPNKDQLEEERREHLHIFNLLGDPMLRLTYPDEIVLEAPREAHPGERLRVSGRSAAGGRGVLELVCRRDCHKHTPPVRERFNPTDKALAEYQPAYEHALDRSWARWAVELPRGEFATEIAIPAAAQGPCHLRLVVTAPNAYSLGATNVYIRPLPVETARAETAVHGR